MNFRPLYFVFYLLTGCLTCNGCTTGTNYWKDRAYDARDIFTVTGGYGGGAKVMAGPLHCGLFVGFPDETGIHGGAICRSESDSFESDWFILPLGPGAPAILRNPPIFGCAIGLPCRTAQMSEMSYTFPFFALPEPHFLNYTPDGSLIRPNGEYHPVMYHENQYAIQYLTECEITVGLGYSARLGVNPGELFDFIVGLFDLDLYGDDGKYNSETDFDLPTTSDSKTSRTKSIL